VGSEPTATDMIPCGDRDRRRVFSFLAQGVFVPEYMQLPPDHVSYDRRGMLGNEPRQTLLRLQLMLRMQDREQEGVSRLRHRYVNPSRGKTEGFGGRKNDLLMPRPASRGRPYSMIENLARSVLTIPVPIESHCCNRVAMEWAFVLSPKEKW
jgi:hypothetical protein